MRLRDDYLPGEPIETIYFGGGTPSLLPVPDLRSLIEKIYSIFPIDDRVEITIETNPDDITDEKLKEWKGIGFNRLSIGIQSFFEEDLKWMYRVHTAQQATNSLQFAIRHFDNITIDLIYGTPLLSNVKWKTNIDKAISFGIPHMSCYALTVEPKTLLQKLINNHKVADISPDRQSEQFFLLMQWMEEASYEHYEISNFAKQGFQSRHNSSYWQGKRYIGIGPSAHSFNGESRQWNISNNNIYIESIKKGLIHFEKEILTLTQQLNEYIMTSLRTVEGLDLHRVGETAGYKLQAASKKYMERKLMIEDQNHLKLTREGKLLADAIAADLFFDGKQKNGSIEIINVHE